MQKAHGKANEKCFNPSLSVHSWVRLTESGFELAKSGWELHSIDACGSGRVGSAAGGGPAAC